MTQKTETRLIALVTGASKGIGLETAKQLLEKNQSPDTSISVVITARKLNQAEQAVNSLKNLLRSSIPQIDDLLFSEQCDINNSEDHFLLKNSIEKRFSKLDILINNAGIFRDGDFTKNNSTEVSQKILRDTFETNFFQLVHLTQTLLPLIHKSVAGRIVNVSSILGSFGAHTDPSFGVSESKAFAYNSSKMAVNSFTLHLAEALKDTSIKVNRCFLLYHGCQRRWTPAASHELRDNLLLLVDWEDDSGL